MRRLRLWFENSFTILHLPQETTTVSNEDDDHKTIQVANMIGHIAIQPPTGQNHMKTSTWKLIRNGFLKIPFLFGLSVTQRLLAVMDKITIAQVEAIDSLKSKKANGTFSEDKDHKGSGMFIIEAFAIIPSYQGQGIGRTVFDYLLNRMIYAEGSDKQNPCFLMTQDKRSARLYESFGFETLDLRKITIQEEDGTSDEASNDNVSFENWIMLKPSPS